jgi:hypothetical protein
MKDKLPNIGDIIVFNNIGGSYTKNANWPFNFPPGVSISDEEPQIYTPYKVIAIPKIFQIKI